MKKNDLPWCIHGISALLSSGILLLTLIPASLFASNPPAPNKPANTLLTGVVVSRSNFLITAEIPVRIYRNGVPIAELIPQNGMFVIDLKDLADQDDMIEVVIWPERINKYDHRSGKSIRTDLAHAQNLSLHISYNIKESKRKRYIRRPSPYTNNI